MTARRFDLLFKAGLLVSVVGLIADPGHFFFSWLVAFGFGFTIVLGMLFFVLLHHAADAGWSTVVRRWAEQFLSAVPLLAWLFVPVLAGMTALYAWTDSAHTAGDHLYEVKRPWLNVPFFVVRAAIYFAVWIWLARALRGGSLAQDESGDPELSLRMRRLAPPGLIAFALTFTFASIDWIMTLDYHWYSTIFGVYVFGQSALAALALLGILAFRLRRGPLKEKVSEGAVHDLGKLTFAFAVFWAYVAFSQWFLIWYANMPEETGWMLLRWSGPWKVVTVLVVTLLFVAPFVLLMRARAKTHPDLYPVTALLVLAGHYLGLYWLVMPVRHPDGVPQALVFVDLGTLALVAGLVGRWVAQRMQEAPLFPPRDPRLPEALPEADHA